MRAWPAWTLCGILAAMLAGTVHAFVEYVLDVRSVGTLAPRDEFADGFGADGYSDA